MQKSKLKIYSVTHFRLFLLSYFVNCSLLANGTTLLFRSRDLCFLSFIRPSGKTSLSSGKSADNWSAFILTSVSWKISSTKSDTSSFVNGIEISTSTSPKYLEKYSFRSGFLPSCFVGLYLHLNSCISVCCIYCSIFRKYYQIITIFGIPFIKYKPQRRFIFSFSY